MLRLKGSVYADGLKDREEQLSIHYNFKWQEAILRKDGPAIILAGPVSEKQRF